MRLFFVVPALTCAGLLAVACDKPSPIERPSGVARASLELRRITVPTLQGRPPGAIAAQDPSGQPILLVAELLVSAVDVQEVTLSQNGGNPVINLRLTPAAGERLARATQVEPGGQIAILIDGRVISTPRVQGSLGREVAIQIPQSQQEAIALAQRLAP